MAIRNIRLDGDDILRKTCRPVTKMDDRTLTLIDDMFDTMYAANGVGLAGPQVGILKQLCVIDCGMEEPEPLVLINPVVTPLDGVQTGEEGCLSVPGYQGIVTRAEHIKVNFLNEDMEECELEADGLLSRCIQHETDHLHGILYTDKVEGGLTKVTAEGEDAE